MEVALRQWAKAPCGACLYLMGMKRLDVGRFPRASGLGVDFGPPVISHERKRHQVSIDHTYFKFDVHVFLECGTAISRSGKRSVMGQVHALAECIG